MAVTLEVIQDLRQEAPALLAEGAAQEASLAVLLQEEVLLEEAVAEDNNTK